MTINLFGKEIELNKVTIVAVSIFLALVIGLIGVIISQKSGELVIDKKNGTIESNTQSASPIATANGNAGVTNKAQQINSTEAIRVYVVGCVKKAGVVTLKKGQIIDDAIKAAGGATKNADLRNINLAYQLADHDMLVINAKKDGQSSNETKTVSKSSTSSYTSSSKSSATSGSKIIKGSGGAVVTEKKAVKSTSNKVNINTATVSELDVLPGVGPATAQKIVAYRNSNGKFSAVEDIKNVSGIGDSKYNAMKDLISVK